MATPARWFALVLLFGFTLEASARTEDWVRYRTPFFSPFRDQSELVIRDRDGAHGRPGARYMKWAINNLGMRGPDAPALKPDGVIRVIMVGASETFGLYESQDREFPRQLADSLGAASAGNACLESAGRRFEVLNAALPGMSLPTIEQDVRMRLARLRADVIVAYPTPVQYLASTPPAPAVLDSTAEPLAIPWTRGLYPRIADRIRGQFKEILPAAVQTAVRRWQTTRSTRERPAGWTFVAPPPDRLAMYDRDLRRLIGTIRGIGAVPVLATHANAFAAGARHDTTLMVMWGRFYPRATGSTIIEFDSLGRLITLRAARDSGVRVVDLPSSMKDRALFKDYAHFTDAGSAHVAAALLPAVQAAGMARAGCERQRSTIDPDFSSTKNAANGLTPARASRRQTAASAASAGDARMRARPSLPSAASPLRKPSPHS